MTVIAALGAGNVGASYHGVPSRGSNTITGVSVDRRRLHSSVTSAEMAWCALRTALGPCRKYRHLRWWVIGLSESRLHDLATSWPPNFSVRASTPKVVAQRGGWSKVATMLDRYAHAIPANDRPAADVLGGMIARER